jgi:hypothetical protein
MLLPMEDVFFVMLSHASFVAVACTGKPASTISAKTTETMTDAPDLTSRLQYKRLTVEELRVSLPDNEQMVLDVALLFFQHLQVSAIYEHIRDKDVI